MKNATQPRNNDATKNKAWAAALNRAIAQGDPNRLRNIAEKVLNQAKAGDEWAIKELIRWLPLLK